MRKTIDDYIAERNAIQLKAEAAGDEAGATQWTNLGVANRHIERILKGELSLTPGVAGEIQKCLTQNSKG